MHMITYPF